MNAFEFSIIPPGFNIKINLYLNGIPIAKSHKLIIAETALTARQPSIVESLSGTFRTTFNNVRKFGYL